MKVPWTYQPSLDEGHQQHATHDSSASQSDSSFVIPLSEHHKKKVTVQIKRKKEKKNTLTHLSESNFSKKNPLCSVEEHQIRESVLILSAHII